MLAPVAGYFRILLIRARWAGKMRENPERLQEDQLNKVQTVGCFFCGGGYLLMGVAFGGPAFLMRALGSVANALPYLGIGSMLVGVGLVLYGAKTRRGRPK